MTRDRWALGGWIVLGVALLLLALSIPYSVWLYQRSGDGGLASVSGSPSDTASFGDSAKLEIRRNSSSENDGVDEVVIVTPSEVDDGSGQELSAEGSAVIGDMATLEIQEGLEVTQDDATPSGGGSGESANIDDSAQFVIRDSDGNIKEQGVLK